MVSGAAYDQPGSEQPGAVPHPADTLLTFGYIASMAMTKRTAGFFALLGTSPGT